MTHEELKECIGEYRELKKDLWWANRWGVQKIEGYHFGVCYNDFAGHWQFSWNDPENEHRVADVEDIFDSQEECEEYEEFGNVTRTDTLKIPFWKDVLDICKTLEEQKRYTKIIYEFDDVELKIYKDNGIWFISIWNYDYDALLSRENYDKARRLCVRLFKGERK